MICINIVHTSILMHTRLGITTIMPIRTITLLQQPPFLRDAIFCAF